MSLRDLLDVSFGNLWRMKLRSLLTIAGVLIAITTFVAMLSFGAGNQRNIEAQFHDLGLFSTMQVYPMNDPGNPDSIPPPKLDAAALERLAAIPGINLVYPYDAFEVTVRMEDKIVRSKAQALPTSAMRTRLFSNILAGTLFEHNTARQTIITDELARSVGMGSADSAVGRNLIVSTRVSTIDSGLAHILNDRGISLLDRLREIDFDSLTNSSYRSRVVRGEVNEVVRRFLSGFVNARQEISETLAVCGIRGAGRVGRVRIEAVIIPIETATRFKSTGMSGNPADIVAAMSSGTFFRSTKEGEEKTYPQATIDFDPKVMYASVRDSVTSLGFRAFSFAEQFEQVQRFFLYFHLGLAVIGLIALITASLGIVNTMVMSITERRREIGVLKSLGADERDIRILFLVESGVIGMIGTAGGILFGWTITRIISAIARSYMKQEGILGIDLFALPAWLVLIALAVGVGVSVLAGLYPAARAARVDAIQALRNE